MGGTGGHQDIIQKYGFEICCTLINRIVGSTRIFQDEFSRTLLVQYEYFKYVSAENYRIKNTFKNPNFLKTD
jgi:hypothetical protein